MAAPKTATKKKATPAKKAPAAKKPAVSKAKKAAGPPKKKFAVKKTLAAAKKKAVKKPTKTEAAKKTTARKAPAKKAPAAATKAAKAVAKKAKKDDGDVIKPVPLYPGNPWFSMNKYYLSAFDIRSDLSVAKCMTAPSNPQDQGIVKMEDKAQLPNQLWTVKHHRDTATGNTFSFKLQQTAQPLYLAPLKDNKVGISVTEYKWHLEYTHVVGASGALKNWPLPTFLWVDTTRDKAIQRDAKTGKLTTVTSAPDKIAQHFHMSELVNN